MPEEYHVVVAVAVDVAGRGEADRRAAPGFAGDGAGRRAVEDLQAGQAAGKQIVEAIAVHVAGRAGLPVAAQRPAGLGRQAAGRAVEDAGHRAGPGRVLGIDRQHVVEAVAVEVARACHCAGGRAVGPIRRRVVGVVGESCSLAGCAILLQPVWLSRGRGCAWGQEC